CAEKKTVATISFGTGDASEFNMSSSYAYRRISGTCPRDGHYTYTPYTSDCFRGDWITLNEDHTGGDILGNMLLVNASYRSGEFFSTMVRGLKPLTRYEFSVWMLNVCKPSEKCPAPLLPNITIRLETVTGQAVSNLNTGELVRYGKAQWTRYSIEFILPAGNTSVAMVMLNHSPGGCGNDFAIDDLTFMECIPPPPPITKKATKPPANKILEKKPVVKNVPKATTTAVKKPASTIAKKTTPLPPKKATTIPAVVKKDPEAKQSTITTVKIDSIKITSPTVKSKPIFVNTPPSLTARTNPIVKTIVAEEGEIRVDLYDNGQIDGDTVSIYHNNKLVLSRARLSAKALTLKITIDANNPHHELVMVANNLGSIPPNTSLMIVTAGSNRYEVFISSNEQNNAKVVFDLKK
ncbi:MAG: hypothetical protein H7Y03_05620, partial [Chitinophagaceae bacterium]|nr:hypothetical protein [Chitinophagaceae bacterium]